MGVLVKELISSNGQYKVDILQNPNGIFQFYIYEWTHEIVEGFGEVCDPYWEEKFSLNVFTDTIESAEKLAIEETLQRTGEILNNEVVTDWVKKYSSVNNVRIVESSSYNVTFTNKQNIQQQNIKSRTAIIINDIFLIQDQDNTNIWYMGIEEEKDQIKCWAKYFSLVEAIDCI